MMEGDERKLVIERWVSITFTLGACLGTKHQEIPGTGRSLVMVLRLV